MMAGAVLSSARFRMKLLPILFFSLAIYGDTLPGFRVQTVAKIDGFASSIATASDGTLYVTTTDGWIHRLAPRDSASTRVTSLPTHAGGNGGLLGMALEDDHTAVVHYTKWKNDDLVLDDVFSRVDLTTGEETVIHAFACDVEVHDRGASSEHHGGNPAIAPDGSIFVGIGEYGAQINAQRDGWNGGRIWRIARDGTVTQWAQGLRNPYDLAWDPELEALVLSDNGPTGGGDEINLVSEGANCGWPMTYGHEPPVSGTVVPQYVFPETVAPTGLARLDGANEMLRHGYLSAAFVTRALYYFPAIAPAPLADPSMLLGQFDEFIIDVTQAPSGEIYFVSALMSGTTTVSRLVVPERGDCDGNGLVDFRDMLALYREIDDGPEHTTVAQNGAFAGSWGCDANADGVIDANDAEALRRLVGGRRRAVR
jgi:glucose/arabinose dehydrogenase